jgi:hypothetical protein
MHWRDYGSAWRNGYACGICTYRVALLAEVIESLGDEQRRHHCGTAAGGLTDDDMDLLDAELAGLKKSGCLLRLAGLRRATLILGRFGISADRIEGMTVSELTLA